MGVFEICNVFQAVTQGVVEANMRKPDQSHRCRDFRRPHDDCQGVDDDWADDCMRKIVTECAPLGARQIGCKGDVWYKE
jgi:hypothetical protein